MTIVQYRQWPDRIRREPLAPHAVPRVADPRIVGMSDEEAFESPSEPVQHGREV